MVMIDRIAYNAGISYSFHSVPISRKNEQCSNIQLLIKGLWNVTFVKHPFNLSDGAQTFFCYFSFAMNNLFYSVVKMVIGRNRK